MIVGTYFDGFDDVAQKLRFDSLAQMKNFGINLVVQKADLSNPAIDHAFPPAAKALGIDVLLSPNTWDYAQLNTVFNANTNVVAWHMQDDADIAGVDATKARMVTLKPHMKVGQKTYITVSKGADHVTFGNLADWYHIQNYHYREGLKKWSWDRILDARKNCKGLLFQGPSLVKMTPIEFGIKQNNLMWMIDGEYTPLSYNKASVMAALCAGANGIIYYTMFYGIAEQVGKNSSQKYYHYILERPDYVEGYKAFHAELQKYDAFWQINSDPTKGTRVTFESGNIVGATFTLNNAAKDWIRVEVDTTEFNANYHIIDPKEPWLASLIKPVVTQSVAKVTVEPGKVSIVGDNIKFT